VVCFRRKEPKGSGWGLTGDLSLTRIGRGGKRKVNSLKKKVSCRKIGKVGVVEKRGLFRVLVRNEEGKKESDSEGGSYATWWKPEIRQVGPTEIPLLRERQTIRNGRILSEKGKKTKQKKHTDRTHKVIT